jgi:hypothetical protein
VRVDAVVASLEDRVTQHVARLVVRVLPDERNTHLVHVLEGFGRDRPAIRALETGLRGVTAEICFHFD